MTKAALRQSMLAALAAVPADELLRRSRVAAERLIATGWWRGSGVVLTYLAMPAETRTDLLVAAARAEEKLVAAPLIEGGELSFRVLAGEVSSLPRSGWGIPQPDRSWPAWEPARAAAAGCRVLVVTPGLAFDRHLNRLGRGKGYYDRFLARIRAVIGPSVAAIGFCLAEQVVREVPRGEGDAPLDGIVTDGEVIPSAT